MNSLISDNLFIVLLIFGGALVCIRGYELYSKPTSSDDPQWLANEIGLRHLTGRRQFVSGFVFYLFPVLLIYLLLSVSPELLSLSMGIAGTTNSVGALTISGSDAQTFAPILAATAVITLFSVRPFSRLELAIRHLSHSVAGVPHSVQRIIRQIREIEFYPISTDSPLPRMQLDHVKDIPGLDKDLVAIGNLDEWIFGTTGMLIWSNKADKVLHLASPRIVGEYDAMKRKLLLSHPTVNKSSSIGQPLTDDSIEDLVRQAREVRIQLTRLLAVLVANQDEPLPEQSAQAQSQAAPHPLWRLIWQAQRKLGSSDHMNLLAASTMVGIVISVVFATLFNFTLTLIHELSINNVALNMLNNELYISGLVAFEFYWSSFVFAAKAAWWDVCGISLIFFTGCSAALAYRSAREHSTEWEEWRAREHSVSQSAKWRLWGARDHFVFHYIVIALISCASACLVYVLYLFVGLVALPSFSVNSPSHFAFVLRDFGSDFAEFSALALLAGPSAVMVCRISDYFDIKNNTQQPQLDTRIRTLGWSVGLLSMILCLLIRQWIGEIHEPPVVFISLLVPSGTLFIMTLAYWHIGNTQPGATSPTTDGTNASSVTRSLTSDTQKELQDNKVAEPVT